MLAVGRTARTKDLKEKITGFEMAGPNMPSTALTDRHATILKTGKVRYVQWSKCTSQDEEAFGPA